MEVLFARVQALVTSVSRLLSDSTTTYTAIESLHLSASQLHHLVVLLIDAIPGIDEILPLIDTLKHSFENMMVIMADRHDTGLPVFTFNSGSRGRPRLEISQAVLEYMIGNRFSVRQIANIINVSTSSVRRYMNLYRLTIRSTYTSISDQDLDTIVNRLQQQHPNSGYRLMRGHLAAMGYRVQQCRVRESLQRIDPVGIARRWFPGIQRRTYSVANPNALWHIDGNHKLIR